MIPALTYNTSQLSGLMLSREQIEQFLITHGLLTATSKDNHWINETTDSLIRQPEYFMKIQK